MRVLFTSGALVLAVSAGGVLLPTAATAADLSAFTAPTLVFGEPDDTSTAVPLDAAVWRLDFTAGDADAAPAARVAVALDRNTLLTPGVETQTPVRRPVAFTYSQAYELRAKIHKYASFLTLPLFGAQALLGVKLDDGTASESVRATHAAIATTMVGLFGVNTVTGVWNLWEGRANPNGHTRRLVHGLLMLASDAGFVATGLLAPTNDGGGNRGLHKGVAFTSIGTATLGYLIMLFGQ